MTKEKSSFNELLRPFCSLYSGSLVINWSPFSILTMFCGDRSILSESSSLVSLWASLNFLTCDPNLQLMFRPGLGDFFMLLRQGEVKSPLRISRIIIQANIFRRYSYYSCQMLKSFRINDVIFQKIQIIGRNSVCR